MVIAFVGQPHRIDDRGTQVLKSLTTIGFDQYYQAEQNGWVLYLEGASDLAILKVFAKTLEHTDALEALKSPFVRYVEVNLPQVARDHFYGLREAYSDLRGVALFDRLEKQLETDRPLVEIMWQKREIENYLCLPEVLQAYAIHDLPDDLFGHADAKKRLAVMEECIEQVTGALRTLGKPAAWSDDIKASDDFLKPLFEQYFTRIGLPNEMRKTNFHILAGFVPKGQIPPEVHEKLDAIAAVANKSNE
jgi:hypothetical protein